MKKSLLLLTVLMCMSFATNAQQVMFDFDANNADLGFTGTWSATGAWPYASFQKVANPNSSGINTSANVGEYLHLGNDTCSLANDLINGNDPAFNQINNATTPYLMVKVLVDKPIDVTIKLNNTASPYWPVNQFTQRVTTVDKWVDVAFDLTVMDDFGNTMTATNYDRFSINFDFDLGDGSINGDSYYFDDVRTVASLPTAIESIKFKNDNSIVDVYNIMGNRIKTQVEKEDALKGLPNGFYIVDGEKVYVKNY